ncbi:hypothetical protein [Achromobacter sp. ES-001]|nr:hypothetical protein [Achromobacter sp. ES-001]
MGDISRVKRAYLEPTGEFSVINQTEHPVPENSTLEESENKP